MKRPILTALAVAALAGCALAPLPAPLFAHVTKAPVGPDGHVAGRPSDLVLHLAVSPDPTGRIPTGHLTRIRPLEWLPFRGALQPLSGPGSESSCNRAHLHETIRG